jgi:hypothetical protein
LEPNLRVVAEAIWIHDQLADSPPTHRQESARVSFRSETGGVRLASPSAQIVQAKPVFGTRRVDLAPKLGAKVAWRVPKGGVGRTDTRTATTAIFRGVGRCRRTQRTIHHGARRRYGNLVPRGTCGNDVRRSVSKRSPNDVWRATRAIYAGNPSRGGCQRVRAAAKAANTSVWWSASVWVCCTETSHCSSKPGGNSTPRLMP